MGRIYALNPVLRTSMLMLVIAVLSIASSAFALASTTHNDPATENTTSRMAVEGGELTWGISDSWRTYLNRSFVGGHTIPQAPAREAQDNRATLVEASGWIDIEDGSGSIEYNGGITSQGHKGYTNPDEWGLDQTLSQLKIELASQQTAKLTALVSQSSALPAFPKYSDQRVHIANLTFSADQLHTGEITASAEFAPDGADIYARLNEKYEPGAAMDDVVFSFTTSGPVPEPSEPESPDPEETEKPDPGQTSQPTPTPSQPTEEPTASAPSTRGVEGSLQWGVRESFRKYVVGPIANGKITPSSGAKQISGNGVFTFPQAARGSKWNGATGQIQYAGNVNFYGHSGVMDVTLSNPIIVVENARSAKVQTHFNGKTITIGNIDLSGAKMSSLQGDAVQYQNAPVTLHSEGVAFFAHNGEGFYNAGDKLDAITFTVGDSSKTDVAKTPSSKNVGSQQTDGGSSSTSNAETPATTTGTGSAAGSLKWGVSSYFAKYTTEKSGTSGCPTPSKHCAGGNIETSGVGSGWLFPQATGGTWNDENHTGTVNFSGVVQFNGYGMTMFQVANPSITVHNDSSATISTGNTTNHGQASYQLDLSRGTKTVNDDGTVTWSNVPVNGALAGISAHQSIGLDPLTLTVGTANDAAFGAGAQGDDGSSTNEATYEAAETAPTTEGLEVLTPADRIREGGRIKVKAEGFDAEDAGILAVLYDQAGGTEPTILDDTATADENGVVQWSGTLPEGITGEHVLTLQGSHDAGAAIDILPAEAIATIAPIDELAADLGDRILIAASGMQPWEWWASAGALLSIAGCSTALTLRHRRNQVPGALQG